MDGRADLAARSRSSSPCSSTRCRSARRCSAGDRGRRLRLLPDHVDRHQRDLGLQHDRRDRALRRAAPVVRARSATTSGSRPSSSRSASARCWRRWPASARPVAITHGHADRAGLPADQGRDAWRWSPTPRRSPSARWPCRSPRWPRCTGLAGGRPGADGRPADARCSALFVPLALVFIVDRQARRPADLAGRAGLRRRRSRSRSSLTSNYFSVAAHRHRRLAGRAPGGRAAAARLAARRSRTSRPRPTSRYPVGAARPGDADRRRRPASRPADPAARPAPATRRRRHRSAGDDRRRPRAPSRRPDRQPRRGAQGLRAVPDHHRGLRHRPDARRQGR